MVTPSLILILAPNSFSGSSFVDHLLTAGHKVIGVRRYTDILPVFSLYKNNKNGNNFTFRQVELNIDKNNFDLTELVDSQFDVPNLSFSGPF